MTTTEKLGTYDVTCPVCTRPGQEYTAQAGHTLIWHPYRQVPCRAPKGYRRTKHHGSCLAVQPDAKPRERCDCGYRAAVLTGAGIPEHAPWSDPEVSAIQDLRDAATTAVRETKVRTEPLTPGELQTTLYRAGVREIHVPDSPEAEPIGHTEEPIVRTEPLTRSEPLETVECVERFQRLT